MGPTMYILAILMLKAVCAAAISDIKPDEVVIHEETNNDNHIDPIRWRYNTSDGESRDESGAILAAGTLLGGYEWISPDGTTFIVEFTADGHAGIVPSVIQLVSHPVEGNGLASGGPPMPGVGSNGPPPVFGGRPAISGNAALSLIG